MYKRQSDHPVYLNIVDDKVEIKDAGFVWGMGTRETTEMLCRKEGVEACVAAIGPAGENLLPYACIINARKMCIRDSRWTPPPRRRRRCRGGQPCRRSSTRA